MNKQKALGENLVYQRTIKGYSQKELSDVSNVTVRTIQRIEKGETDPHLQTTKLLADGLGIEVSDLLCIEDPKHEDIQKKWLLLLHSTPFVGFVIPLANLFFPLFLWIHKRDDNPVYWEHGRKILNFQITMSILFAVSVFLLFFSDLSRELPTFALLVGIIIYFVVVSCVNIFLAITRKRAFYPLSIPFISKSKKEKK